MISVEDLADLLNSAINSKVMDAINELWDDDCSPFDTEHDDILPMLEKVCDAINEKSGLMDFEIDDE